MLLYQSEQFFLKTNRIALSEIAVSKFEAQEFDSKKNLPTWDSDFMFKGSETKTIAWFLAFNAINYSFWPDPGNPRWFVEISGKHHGIDDEAFGIMASLTEAMNQGTDLSDPGILTALDASDMEQIFRPAEGAGELPLLDQRLRALHELGRAYERLGGPQGLIALGEGSATKLAQALARELPSWEDSRMHQGHRLRFLKRAQLCVAMIFGRFNGQGPGNFSDVADLTAFADYRLPQILRHLGILVFSNELAEAIERGRIFEAGSPEEVEIRCATIVAVERIRAALSNYWPSVTALHVDYLLWSSAVSTLADLPEHHRCRCTDY